jgi:hypothetical protein
MELAESKAKSIAFTGRPRSGSSKVSFIPAIYRQWHTAATAAVRPSARSVGYQKAILKFHRLVDLVAGHE